MGAIQKAFDDGVKANTDLDAKVDGALIASGRQLCAQIDYAVENLEGAEVTKAMYLVPHLVNILKEMRATPAVRVAVAGSTGTPPAKKTGLASVSNIPRPGA